jgi:hypothetical protein
MISLNGMNHKTQSDFRNFLKSELDECLRRCDLIEVARSKYKRDEDHPAKENLTRSLMHYEGRVRQIRRTFYALDGRPPIQEPFILERSAMEDGVVAADPMERKNNE